MPLSHLVNVAWDRPVPSMIILRQMWSVGTMNAGNLVELLNSGRLLTSNFSHLVRRLIETYSLIKIDLKRFLSKVLLLIVQLAGSLVWLFILSIMQQHKSLTSSRYGILAFAWACGACHVEDSKFVSCCFDPEVSHQRRFFLSSLLECSVLVFMKERKHTVT